MLNNILQKRDFTLKVASKHDIQNVRVLGFVKTNLDLLVDVEEGKSLFDLIGFKQELEELLHISVIANLNILVV